jgi:HPt (histidine-containing phosphotransfer) domain-containing protein
MKATSLSFGKKVAVMLLASSSFVATAATTGGFKMVLIEDTPGVGKIKAGLYQDGIAEASASTDKQADLFSKQMSLCVAYTHLAQFKQAEQACSAAIYAARRAEGTDSSYKREMRSFAHTNRGVARLLGQDPVAALADFQLATTLEQSDINQHNLTLLNDKIKAVSPVYTAATLKMAN